MRKDDGKQDQEMKKKGIGMSGRLSYIIHEVSRGATLARVDVKKRGTES